MSDALDNRIAAVKPVEVPAISAAKLPVVQTSSSMNAPPADEENSILAVELELAKLGYYGGPITRGSSQQLLMALRSTKTEIKRAVARRGATINLQAAQDLINGRVPATLVTTADEGVPSEGYLPPWDALRERYTQIALSPPPRNSGALTVRVSARTSRMDTRRRARRSYASARRRSRFVYNYGGFFGF
jgi:hypothetical protein